MAADEDPDADQDANGAQPFTLDEILQSFDKYCLPRRNLAMESFKYHTISQKEKQTNEQMQYCEFDYESCSEAFADRMLRDRIIVGVYDRKLQLKLLDGKDESLASIMKC